MLVAELKDSETDACSDSELEIYKGTDKGKNIIYVDLTIMVATTKLQNVEPENPEGGSASSTHRCG